jgi:Mrp family chromosome partitioning ATPase
MRRLKNDYNYIIIDSPPASHLTDPVVLARHVDFVLLVASKYTSKLKIVQENYTNLKNINKNIALIINRVEQSKYSYRYYYDYRYGEDSSEMSSNVSKPRRIFRKA